MEPDFWHQRWQTEQIGFHQNQINPYLLKHWPTMKMAAPARVFVPLCGKTLDLLWLAQQGYRVIGSEISSIAVEAFFTENNFEPQCEQYPYYEKWQAGSITILCGDFFDLQPGDLGDIDVVYDRAALIALPPDLRRSYVDQMLRLAAGLPQLLITLEYPQHQMDGPPFAVSEKELREHYAGYFQVEVLERVNILAQTPRFRERGLSQLNEVTYRLLPQQA